VISPRTLRDNDDARVVIVGGGPAGLATAEELRALGFAGTVTVIHEEPYPPYDRPACSKDLLNGRKRPADVLLPLRPHANIEWRAGVRAVALSPGDRTLLVDTGEEFSYDRLVIATGTQPVTPPEWRYGAPGLHKVHGLADAIALRRDIQDARNILIVGGGLTGCEVAYVARSMRRECVLVDSHPQVLTRAVGERVGWLVTQQMHRDGISLRLGRRLQSVDRVGGRWRVHLDNGDIAYADVVVAALGERPATSWLSGSGCADENGVNCDESLRIVGIANIFAAGSVARWPNRWFGSQPTSQSHWISALEQGRAVARRVLADGPPPPVTLIPRYAVELGELRIEVGGVRPDDATESIVMTRPGRADAARAGVVVRYTKGNRTVGVVTINATEAFMEGMSALRLDFNSSAHR
jgi:NADPH-dependent 2,4-dienoyl-CoA reductase/sulfur reductase-like enzyme